MYPKHGSLMYVEVRSSAEIGTRLARAGAYCGRLEVRRGDLCCLLVRRDAQIDDAHVLANGPCYLLGETIDERVLLTATCDSQR